MTNRRKAFYWISCGFGVHVLTLSLLIIIPDLERFIAILQGLGLLGQVGFLVGCVYLAKSKGWHWAVGFVGFLGIFGVLVLLQLHDIPGAAEDPLESKANRRAQARRRRAGRESF